MISATYKSTGKKNFRLSEVKRKYGKWLLLSSLLCCGLSYAADEKMVDSALLASKIEDSLRDEFSLIAKKNQWHDYQFQVDVRVPKSASYLPYCSDMRIYHSDKRSLPIGSFSRRVECHNQESSWKLNIRIKTTLTLPVIVAKNAIARATKLTKEQLEKESKTFTTPQYFVTQYQSVVGQQAKRRIRRGQILNPNNLEQSWLIEKGDEVIIVAQKDGLTASMKGLALENGAIEQQIKVKNISSNKVIKAYVTARGKVATLF